MSADDIRATLWFWPSVVAVMSLVAALLLLRIRPQHPGGWAGYLWPGSADTASTVLQVVATSVMAATTLTFSLTVVALQLASQQFSPRLLREFARDKFTQSVLAILVSTFVVCLTGLRGLGDPERLPVIVVALGFVLGFVSVGALLAFVGHIVKVLRVDTMMLAVHGETAATVAQAYPEYDDLSRVPSDDLPGPDGGVLLHATHSGFVRVIRPGVLVVAAAQHGLFVRLGLRPGDHVVTGSPLASVWRTDGGGQVDVSVLADAAASAVEIGFERTVEQDAALGLRQLTDIAVKALSPGINDPTTAAHAVTYCSDLIRRIQSRHLGPQQHDDADGEARLVLPDRDYRYYLDLVCGPIRRFGAEEPIALLALLRMLRDCAASSRDDVQRTEISRQASLVLAQMSNQLLEDDAGAVHDLAGRVQLALQGDIDSAYRDRAGETRST